MKLALLSVLVFFMLPHSPAQDLSAFPPEMIARANTAQGEGYLSQVEKDVILYMNLARMDGNMFLEYIARPYIAEHTKSTSYTRSLIRDLKKVNDLSPLLPQRDLYDAALEHATTMGKSGRIGHGNFSKRMKDYLKKYNVMAENCSYGSHDAIEIVMDLLIDEGISGLGHRKNILNENMLYVGVATAPHRKYETNCVQIFGGKLY